VAFFLLGQQNMQVVRTKATAVANAVMQQLPDGSGLSGVNGRALDSFINFQHKMGLGADNVLSSSTYGFNPITRNRILLEWIHRGSWLGGVAVNTVASDMTRAGIEYATELPAEASDKMDELAVELGIWSVLEETIQMGRLYGGAICVALIEGQDMRTPLDLSTVGPGQFKGLYCLDRWMLDPTLEDCVSEMGPNLGLPRYYRVQPNAPALKGQVIHHSRVMLRHVGAKLPFNQRMTENLWGCSVLERLYDRMVSYDLASTGAAQLVTKSYVRTLKVKGLREIAASGGPPMDGLAKYMDFMRRMQGIEGMTAIDSEDELGIDGHQAFSGLADCMSSFAEQLSGALDIPLIRLFGQSPGGFSDGDGNLRNYYDHINKSQNSELRVGVTKVYRMMAQSKSIKLPADFTIAFRSLWQMDMPEKVEGIGKLVDAVTTALDAGLISVPAAMRELRQASRVFGVFSNITEDDIEQAELLTNSMPGADTVLGQLAQPGQPGGPGGPPLPPGLPDGFGPEHAAGAALPTPGGEQQELDLQPVGLPTGFGPEHIRKGLPAGFGPEYARAAIAPVPVERKRITGLPAGFGPEHIGVEGDKPIQLPEGFGPKFLTRPTNANTQDSTPGSQRKKIKVRAREGDRKRIRNLAAIGGQAGGGHHQGDAAGRSTT